MRICRIHSNIHLNPKGFGIGLYELSSAQKELNNDVYIIAGKYSSFNIKNQKYNNLSYNFVPYFTKLDILNGLIPFGIFSFFRLNQLIKNNLIDLLHTHDVDAFYPIIRNKKVPLVHTFHVDKQAQMTRTGSKNLSLRAKIIENLRFKLNYPIWKKANAIICISKQTMNRLIKYYKVPSSKIHYIPNGVNRKKFHPINDSSEIKSSLKINQNNPIILFIGRIYNLKGIKELIMSLTQIKRHYPKILLLIIGSILDPNYYSEVLTLIRKNDLISNIKFMEQVPYSLMPRLYQASDIFILPSYSEGMPKVVLEAMASRLCIITTNLEGNKDLIQNNVNGILIKPRSVSDITDNLLKVIEDKKLREKYANNAWKTAEQYDWLIIAQKVQEIYKKVLNH